MSTSSSRRFPKSQQGDGPGSVPAPLTELKGWGRCSAKNRRPLRRAWLVNPLHYPWEGFGSKMDGTRGCKREGDVGEFDIFSTRDFDHHSRWLDGGGRGASIEGKRGRSVYAKSVGNRGDLGIDQGDVVGVGAPGVGI